MFSVYGHSNDIDVEVELSTDNIKLELNIVLFTDDTVFLAVKRIPQKNW